MKNRIHILSIDLNILFVKEETALLSYWEIENSIFSSYFFNMNVSVTIDPIHFKSSYIILCICMEGTVSQYFDKAQTFCFMKGGKSNLLKMQKVSLFLS